MGPAWTAGTPLPGGDIEGGDFDAYVQDLQRRHPGLDAVFLRRLARRHGTNANHILAGAQRPADLGDDLGHGLTAREVAYLRDHEWARTADDVLWRRTKIGLHLTPAERERAMREITRYLARA